MIHWNVGRSVKPSSNISYTFSFTHLRFKKAPLTLCVRPLSRSLAHERIFTGLNIAHVFSLIDVIFINRKINDEPKYPLTQFKMIKTIQYCYILKFTTFAIAGETKEKEVLRLRKY